MRNIYNHGLEFISKLYALIINTIFSNGFNANMKNSSQIKIGFSLSIYINQ